jgi:hypothetical protein
MSRTKNSPAGAGRPSSFRQFHRISWVPAGIHSCWRSRTSRPATSTTRSDTLPSAGSTIRIAAYPELGFGPTRSCSDTGIGDFGASSTDSSHCVVTTFAAGKYPKSVPVMSVTVKHHPDAEEPVDCVRRVTVPSALVTPAVLPLVGPS